MWLVQRLVLSLLLAALASGCIRVPPLDQRIYALGEAAEPELGERVRVLVWNIYKSNRESWRDDFPRVAQQHDLLMLQEAWWDDETRPTYAAIHGIGWWLGVTFEMPLAGGKTGTLIGCRAAARGPIQFQHSPFRDALAHTPKSHIAVKLGLAGSDRELLAVSVHATNLHIEQRPFELHVEQILGTVRAHSGPVILAGDFNTWSEGRTAFLFDRVAQLELRSVFPRGPATSERDDGRMTWNDNYLDHAFVRGVAVEGRARVLSHLDSSDHSALSFVVATRAAAR